MTDEVINPDHDRILCHAILECTDEWQDQHHTGDVTVATANAELLTALANVLGFIASTINCTPCRKGLAAATQELVQRTLEHAVAHPANPDADESAHVH
jgi:NADH:ubiquinone oxidoreductase subunit F (NADH-binding)